MTDPSLTPEQEQAVRRALAGVRPTGPPPPDVVARLDATLADLTADRRSDAPTRPTDVAPVIPPVIPLATRRRRWARAALVAAAAVVVAGVGLGPLVNSWQGGAGAGDDSTTGAMLEEDSGDAGAYSTQESAPADGQDLDELFSADDRPMSGFPQRTSGGVPQVRPARFKRDAVAVRDLPVELSADAPESEELDPEAGTRSGDMAFDPAWAACGPAAGDGERSVAVTYQRQPAVLLFRAPAGGSQLVELHLCRDAGPARVATLPAP